MRFTTFLQQGRPRLGVIDGDAVVDLNAARPEVPSDLRAALEAGVDVIAAGRACLASAAPRVALAGLALRAARPRAGQDDLPRPQLLRPRQGRRPRQARLPWFFFRGKSSLLGHGAAGRVPRVSSKFDYEAELAVVIGTRVPRHVGEGDALRHVFGYSCFNDMSVRDYQKRTPQWTIGKNFDATGGFGPVLVTADELTPGAKGLRIQSRLNGQVMQDANTDDMIFSVAETIALLSECLTLDPGDAIIMGTPAGVGQARTPPVWMKAGDTIEIEIERIGVLTNPIASESA